MKVEVVETTLVPPSEATPRHALWLSNLDLAVPKTHTPLVYYYPKPKPNKPSAAADEGADSAATATDSAPFFDPARLRDALARALVPFYPLAGRLATGPGGRVEIDCTGEGALFAVARADFAGDDVFRDFEPSPDARRLLVPFAASGEPPCVLAMVQALSAPYLKNGHHQVPHLKSSSPDKSKDSHGEVSLKGRGLCLVPISSTFAVASEVPVDFWTPFGANFR